MKYIFNILILVYAFSGCADVPNNLAKKMPDKNVLFIIVDDLTPFEHFQSLRGVKRQNNLPQRGDFDIKVITVIPFL